MTGQRAIILMADGEILGVSIVAGSTAESLVEYLRESVVDQCHQVHNIIADDPEALYWLIIGECDHCGRPADWHRGDDGAWSCEAADNHYYETQIDAED